MKSCGSLIKRFFSKRGATTENMLMMIGILMVFAIVMVLFSQAFNKQADLTEKEFAAYFLKTINQAITKSQTELQDSRIPLKLAFTEPYTLTVEKNTISVTFPRKKLTYNTTVVLGNLNLLDSYVDNVGTLIVAKRGRSVLITDEVRCDITDDVCDAGCVITGQCDPVCEVNAAYCNPACTATATCDFVCATQGADECALCRGGNITACNPHCYSNTDKGFYDTDCVRSNDTICDPASNLVIDGICDKDCLGLNGVCDPDCTNQALFDQDCPVERNGVCDTSRRDNCLGDCACLLNETCSAFCADAYLTSVNPSTLCATPIPRGQFCEEDCACSTGFCKTDYSSTTGLPTGNPGRCCGFLDFSINGVCRPARALFNDTTICWPQEPFLMDAENAVGCSFIDGVCASVPSETCANSIECPCLNSSGVHDAGLCCVGCGGSGWNTTSKCCNSTTAVCGNLCKTAPLVPSPTNGTACDCDNECLSPRRCILNVSGPGKNCCAPGNPWNGTDCYVPTGPQPCVPGACVPGCVLPSSIDWRAVNGKNFVSAVKNQGWLGTCWAHAAAAVVESRYAIELNVPATKDVSELSIATCCPTCLPPDNVPLAAFSAAPNFNLERLVDSGLVAAYTYHGHPDMGSMAYLAFFSLRNNQSGIRITDEGADSYPAYPGTGSAIYTAGGTSAPPDRCDNPSNGCTCTASSFPTNMYRLTDFDPPAYFETWFTAGNTPHHKSYQIGPISSYSDGRISEVKRAIFCQGPVACGWAITSGGAPQGNHEILCMGYNDMTQAIIVKNSWGPTVGTNGFHNIHLGTDCFDGTMYDGCNLVSVTWAGGVLDGVY